MHELNHPDAAAVLARLADLRIVGGEALAVRLTQNFQGHLEGLLSEPRWTKQQIHRALGLAGMLGFGRLEQALRRLDDAPDAISSPDDLTRSEFQQATALIAILSE